MFLWKKNPISVSKKRKTQFEWITKVNHVFQLA